VRSGRIITRPDGKRFHVGGRTHPRARGPRLSLKNYLDHACLAPAPDCDYTGTAQGLSDVLANDQLGDCTCAGVLHALEAILGAAGTPVAFTAQQAITLYSLACGYNPNDPSATDQGGDELAVLDYVAEHGIDGQGLHQIAGSILVDATNEAEVRWAVWALCNVYFGVALPDAWVNPFPSGSGFTWGPGSPDPSNGHCFVGNKTSAAGVGIDTWGEEGLVTFPAVAQLAVPSAYGELHTIVTKELIAQASQKTPAGFAWQDLLADLSAIGAIAA
jgi:hypothetical protein